MVDYMRILADQFTKGTHVVIIFGGKIKPLLNYYYHYYYHYYYYYN